MKSAFYVLKTLNNYYPYPLRNPLGYDQSSCINFSETDTQIVKKWEILT